MPLYVGGAHTWSGILRIWEIHATSQPGQAERLHEFPKSGGFPAMYASTIQHWNVLPEESNTTNMLSIEPGRYWHIFQLLELRCINIFIITN